MPPTTMPYGTWPSPVSAERLAAGSAYYGQVVAPGGAVLFTKSDPETGEMRLRRWTPERGIDVLAEHLNVRSRVHEYGGGAVVARGDTIVVTNFTDQRLYRVDGDGSSQPVTPASDARVRWADGVLTDDGRLVAIRETHHDDRVANELVALTLDGGDQAVLVGDHDFVAAPRLGPAGRLAWLAWDHPDMPWDAAAAWTGRLTGDGLADVTRVAGGDGVAVSDLAWRGDGSLVVTVDDTGFWEIAVVAGDDGGPTRLTDRDHDLGKPRMLLGLDRLAVVGDDLVVVATDHAVDRLGVVDPGGTWRELPGTAVSIEAIAAHGDRSVVAIEQDADGGSALRVHDLDGSVTTIDAVAPITERPGDLAEVLDVTVAVDGAQTHAFLHPPANADVVGPDDELPPLLVFVHGGPTGHRSPARPSGVAYWTTRGFAVAVVNYRGSSGYGRAYRDALRHRWGLLDVADVVAVAGHLAREGTVDGSRMALRGGSAGGYTTLATVTRPDHPFTCGTSFFGVADLAALARHTHKFESRYLDGLVGRLPEDRAVYDERSPLTHLDRLAVPILVLQGTEDKVVPPQQARMIVDAAAERGLPHALVTFEGEGHGFRRPGSIATWHRTELAFYGEVMGFTPAGDLPTVLG